MSSKTSLFLILIFLTFGCKSNTLPYDSLPTFTYLALGDSYTIGEGVAEDERFPIQLQDSLNNRGVNIEKVKIIARTGWTTGELATAIHQAQTDSAYDLVSLLIGVNNQYRGRSLESYREEFVQLLNQSIAFAGGHASRVVVLSIPDWGVTPFAEGRDREKIAAEIDAFNTVNKEESNSAGTIYLDITAISRQAASRPELIAPDGLHPSGMMYAQWVQEMVALAVEALKK
jgi:lysophospholipase L1-like esterase